MSATCALFIDKRHGIQRWRTIGAGMKHDPPVRIAGSRDVATHRP